MLDRVSKLVSTLMLPFLAAGILLVATGCSWKAAGPPSILLILVEGLGFNAFTCSDEISSDQTSGFHAFCQESVRFTHAYSVSVMSQPSIASIFTGVYPHEHSVVDNGPSYLQARFDTVAEAAVRRRYRTSFFSGGPPIWRKSGLGQGFELFEDNIQPTPASLYRPFLQNVGLFMNWLDSEAAQQTFFSVLYVPDLQFIDSPTINDLGDVRESSYRSQKEELDESLSHLVRELKSRKLWDGTHIFLVGLNGHPYETRSGEARATNLYSETTHVSLMIKPARKVRDGPYHWKVNSNVVMTDIGATLFDLIGEKPPTPTDSFLEVVSLKRLFEQAEVFWSNQRVVLTESGWARWREQGIPRFALREGPFLLMYDQPIKFFNTLTDRLETVSLTNEDTPYRASYERMVRYFRDQKQMPWPGLPVATVRKVDLGEELWRRSLPRSEALRQLRFLSKKYPDDMQLLGWRAIWALRMEDWEELRTAGQQAGNPVWFYVGSRNLGLKAPEPETACFQYFKPQPRPFQRPALRECANEQFLDLLTWVHTDIDSPENLRSREMFLRSYITDTVDRRIAEHNFVSGLMWDVALSEPSGPMLADLYLALPENRRFRIFTDRRLIQ